MSVTIKSADSLSDLKKFVRFPLRLYKGNNYFVPSLTFDELNTLQSDKNPAFEYCESKLFLAYKDGKVVGRVAGIINNRYVEKWGNKYVRFGWIDFIDDREVSKALLDAVAEWGKSKGMIAMHGPLGFTDLDKEALLVEGFDQVGTMATIYNFPYYPEHIEAYGLQKDADWVEFLIYTPKEIPEKVLRVQELVLKREKLHFVEAKKSVKPLLPYVPQMFALIDEAYSHLYGTVPFSEKQMEAYKKQYMGFVDTDFTKFIVNEKNELVAFCIVMPSLSKALQKANGSLFPFGFAHLLRALKKADYIDMYLIAVKPELRAKGIAALLMGELNKNAIKRGVIAAESNPEMENNVEVQGIWKAFEHKQHKRRRVYIKKF